MHTISSGRFIAETIKDYGATHVFFVPAVFLDAVHHLESLGVQMVTTHHEVAAAYMADGYARASRRPGVCFAASVGAANLAAGLREPFLSSSPVLSMTGGPHPDSRYRYLYQVIDDFPMFEAVTKFNATVEKATRLPDLLRQAFRMATTGSPGPVHLEVPGRQAEGINCEAEFQLGAESQFSQVPAYRIEPDSALLLKAATLLAAAHKPVILAGGGVVTSGASAELVRLAERLSIPVVTSPTGKGCITESHPLALGVVGSYGRWSANQAVEEADLVLVVGSRLGGLTTRNWQLPRPGTPSIQVDIEPGEIGRNYPATVGLLGDASATLRRLVEAVPEIPSRPEWVEHTQDLLARWRAEIEPQSGSDSVPIRPERLCREITEFLPADGVVVADTGHATIWSGTMVELRRPGQRYFRCAGTLGWAVPGSIGVKCALPKNAVLCFTGDGGFYYHMAEMETAARCGINLVVVVNNNGQLQQPKKGFEKGYGEIRSEIGQRVWDFAQTDLKGVAESLGCLGIRVTRPGEIRGALEEAFAANRPAVIDMASDPNGAPRWG